MGLGWFRVAMLATTVVIPVAGSGAIRAETSAPAGIVVPDAVAAAHPDSVASLRELEARLGPADPEVARRLAALGVEVSEAGDTTGGRLLLEQAAALQERTLGPSHPDLAETLGSLGDLLIQLGDYATAEPLLERSLALREAHFGGEHRAVADSMNSLAVLHWERGELEEARVLYERALAIWEATVGPDDLEVATCRSNLGMLLDSKGDYAAAEADLERALAIRESKLGPEHPDVATVLNNLGLVVQHAGQYGRARPLLERALAIREGALGAEHPRVAVTLNNLALVVYEQGDYAVARSLFERTLALREKLFGPEHRRVAVALNNLAGLLQTLGELDQARPLYERALRIDTAALGPEHPETAQDLANLGFLLKEKGDYATARPLYERALEIREKALGGEHPQVAASLANLAQLLDVQGDLASARVMQEKALAIREKTLGPEHPDVAYSVNNLAFTLRDLGDHSQARVLFERALRIWESALGPDHDLVALARLNLASELRHEGDLATAEGLTRQALETDVRVLGPDSPTVARDLGQLMLLSLDRGDLKAARRLGERALGLYRATVGPEHPDVASTLASLGTVAWRAGRQRQARTRYLEAGRIVDANASRLLPTLSTAEQRAYLTEHVATQTDLLLSACRKGASLEEAYRLLARWKGLLIESLRRQQALSRLATDPNLGGPASRLQALRVRLAGWYQRVGSMPLDEWKRTYEGLTADKEALERELVRASSPAILDDPLKTFDLERLLGSLGPDEALVDVYRHQLWRAGSPADSRYVAVVAGRQRRSVLVDLGAAEAVEHAVRVWSLAVRTERDARPQWERLRQLVWQPIRQALPRRSCKVWLSPDGELARVPWHLLPEDGDLCGPLLVSQVDSTRELARLRQSRQLNDTGPLAVLLVGGVDFGPPADGSKERGGEGFPALPGTVQEVAELAAICEEQGYRTVVLEGRDATKQAVATALAAVDVAHLATHGFFFDAAPGGGVTRGTLGPAASVLEGDHLAPRNPLVESGIALARANQRDRLTEGAEGLLTAEELVGVDLGGCQMVVLSACDTGRGEEVTGQGVMGLRASVVAAGARSVVMSLWRVPDESTHRLMTRFYHYLWHDRLPRVEALRRAQLDLRDDPSGELSLPVHWAGWALAGEGW